MIKEFKKIINNFLDDKDLPMFIKEIIVLAVLIAITLILMLFIAFPEIMFSITGAYLIARLFIEILRRN